MIIWILFVVASLLKYIFADTLKFKMADNDSTSSSGGSSGTEDGVWTIHELFELTVEQIFSYASAIIEERIVSVTALRIIQLILYL